MKNLAGDPNCDDFIDMEIRKAGLKPLQVTGPHRDEVPYGIYAEFGSWTFTRAWTYWVAEAAEGTGVPIKAAERFNPLFGDEARAAGFAGGLPNGHLQGWLSRNDTIDTYHIDTMDALIDFVNMLKGKR